MIRWNGTTGRFGSHDCSIVGAGLACCGVAKGYHGDCCRDILEQVCSSARVCRKSLLDTIAPKPGLQSSTQPLLSPRPGLPQHPRRAIATLVRLEPKGNVRISPSDLVLPLWVRTLSVENIPGASGARLVDPASGT